MNVPAQLDGLERELRLHRVESLQPFGFAVVPPGFNELRGDELVLSTLSGLTFGYRKGDGVRMAASGALPPDDREVELWLHGSIRNAVAAIHGLIPIHASAIATPGGVIAIAGPSGSGKSTTAMMLAGKEAEWFADDTLLLDPNTHMCLPGRRQWKLDTDAMAMVGARANGPPLAIDDKFRGIPPGGGVQSATRLAEIVLLEKGGETAFHPISAGQAAAGLLADSDRWHLYARALESDAAGVLGFFARFCGNIGCHRLIRGPRGNAAAIRQAVRPLLEGHSPS